MRDGLKKKDQSHYYRHSILKGIEVSRHFLTNIVLDDLDLDLKDIENSLDMVDVTHKTNKALTGIKAKNAKHCVLSSNFIIAKTMNILVKQKGNANALTYALILLKLMLINKFLSKQIVYR